MFLMCSNRSLWAGELSICSHCGTKAECFDISWLWVKFWEHLPFMSPLLCTMPSSQNKLWIINIREGCNLCRLKILPCIFHVKIRDVNYLPLKWIIADSNVMIKKHPKQLGQTIYLPDSLIWRPAVNKGRVKNLPRRDWRKKKKPQTCKEISPAADTPHLWNPEALGDLCCMSRRTDNTVTRT